MTMSIITCGMDQTNSAIEAPTGLATLLTIFDLVSIKTLREYSYVIPLALIKDDALTEACGYVFVSAKNRQE